MTSFLSIVIYFWIQKYPLQQPVKEIINFLINYKYYVPTQYFYKIIIKSFKSVIFDFCVTNYINMIIYIYN